MKSRRIRDFSLQGKMSLIFIGANLILLVGNIAMLMGINTMAKEMDLVYEKNLYLNELGESLTEVQNSMSTYLRTKTSDSLEDYYRSQQGYSLLVDGMKEQITGRSYDRMERNIKKLSEDYLEEVGQTVEAKRGRNVEKYRVRYESATRLYNYIDTYISSLNNEQFKSNSINYRELLASFRSFERVSIVVLLTVIVGNVVVVVLLTGTVIYPLKELARSANEVARGNFHIELKAVQSQDEIGVVTGAFNQMVVSIGQYIEQIKERMEVEQALREKELRMEAHLKGAQLKYLQAQINPHFLFNTLNAGAQLAMMEEADRTYKYIQNMADFFRYNVRKGEEPVSLREELELVDSYLYILNVRFSGEIYFEKHVDKGLLDIQMPSMILQPIVENCVNHGIREIDWPGTILLRIYRRGDTACISIKDNGVGMSQRKIDKILAGRCREEELLADSNGVGMDNVISRLKLFYGSEDVMTIASQGKNQGTEVIIYLRTGEKDV